MTADRTIVLWCPDWPVIAAITAERLSPDAPVALIEKGLVFASSASARREGVIRGLRVREAQYRCPDVIVLPYDVALDARAFEPVLRVVEEAVPAVQVVRPGTLAMRARGPARYYGGEAEAARALLATVREAEAVEACVGVADGLLAAEQAARAAIRVPGSDQAQPPVFIVAEGSAASFLAPLPVSLVTTASTATLLHRLGVRSLGEFAALPAADVLRRFGPEGALAHARAGARDGARVVPRSLPPEFEITIDFEPPLDRIDSVAFAIRARADEFIDRMRAVRLVCTGLRVEVHDDRGQVSTRIWLHPRWFSAPEVVDRVRWQLQGSGSERTAGSGESSLGSPIARVHFFPERVDSTGNHEEGLWGSGPDERVHHGLSRVQSILGHEGVLTPTLGGGRMLADRQVLVPWGDRAPAGTADRPWPGRIAELVPSTVYTDRVGVSLRIADGSPLSLDDRGVANGAPESFTDPDYRESAVRAWAGPWPVVERWWDAENARRIHRFQIIDDSGTAWLLVRDGDRWWAEARYD
ncbi:DNA polymerase Y family protein [Agromyces atrinae]|uniref:DNA polymerase Y family protein n=1 Tax=Agromyces atrinae TaxID=592376 RepID=UPI001F575395|nr:DNA polymerase Y family protein [Agromyces atrinae]MCI2958632.1 DNA polymerase Y family protein [Agromyces atrinae]